MEYRQSTRKPLNQKILIESPRVGLTLTSVRDLSLGGMRVAPSPGGLEVGSRVVVSFALPLLGERRGFRFQAAVVRCDRDAVGLMFENVTPRLQRTLGDALFEMSTSRERAVRSAPTSLSA
jgi:c-di-GMP-binding flagellar brake protein YcgR